MSLKEVEKIKQKKVDVPASKVTTVIKELPPANEDEEGDVVMEIMKNKKKKDKKRKAK